MNVYGIQKVNAAVIGRQYLQYNVEFWNIYFTDSLILFCHQGESFRNFFLRWDIPLKPLQSEVDVDALLAADTKSYVIVKDELCGVVQKPATIISLGRLVIKTKSGLKSTFMLGPENRNTPFAEVMNWPAGELGKNLVQA